MPAVFITATGTDIGKTFVTAGLARYLRAHNRKVAVLKPVVSGFDIAALAGSDSAVLLESVGQRPDLGAIESISPWRFTAPLSPDMAGRLEGEAIDFPGLVAFCRAAIDKTGDVLLIEGIGGLMVPFTANKTVLDLIEALRIPSILVAGTYVGTLSHTLTAMDVMARRGVNPAALVLNETAGSAASIAETVVSLRHFCDPVPILSIAREGTGNPADINAASFGKIADLVLTA
ncbi:MAG: dethiobiotin synthase [Beijerinckiaceae bacterium]|nr:MAG: dethiobiotin synthase [Beijerinckiaceae bacterium]